MRLDSGIDAYTKGAPEHVIQCCVSMLTDEGSQPIDRPYLNQQAINLAQSGFRVLALGGQEMACSTRAAKVPGCWSESSNLSVWWP